MADCSKTDVFLAEWERMCMSFDYCSLCDANEITCDTRCVEANRLEEMRNIVQKWSDAHPKPKPKTYADVFFEKFPNAIKDEDGTPPCCREFIYGQIDHNRCTKPESCKKCWNEPFQESEN